VARVSSLGAELAARHAGKAVVLVAHSEVIGPFAATAGGKTEPQDLLPKVANGSITTVECALDGGRRLVALGVVPEP
jgi:broad specificity phosphatase PhoE